jgi:hypothetical protein
VTEYLQVLRNTTKAKVCICKAIGIKDSGEVILKGPRVEEVGNQLQHTGVSIVWAICPSYDAASLRVRRMSRLQLVEQIIQGLKDLIQQCQYSPVGISIDAEPLINFETNLNSIPFHIAIILQINQQLQLPVSMYSSPNYMSRETENMLDDLFAAIKNHPGNRILIPAYTAPDPCLDSSLLDSANLLTRHEVPFKHIIATRYEGLEERLRFLASRLSSRHQPFMRGYVIYPMSHKKSRRGATLPHEEAMALVRHHLGHQEEPEVKRNGN